jgi:TonB family protein
METLGQPPAANTSTEPEYKFLLTRDYSDDWPRWRQAALGSLVCHVVAITVLFLYHEDLRTYQLPERTYVPRVTHLYLPKELTQKAPNKQPVSKELSVEAIAPRPILRAPSPAPAARKGSVTPPAAPPPPTPPPEAAPKPTTVEPPKIESPVVAQQPQIVAPAPPKVDTPKPAFEDVARQAGPARPTGQIQAPNPSIQEAVKNLSRSGGLAGQSVGDLGVDEGGAGAGLNLPPSAGRPRSNLELKSDPMGVDFRPYMLQVLAAVKRNWFAVYPEAARLGQRGQVALEFSIVKAGGVTKVIFSGQSGVRSLDQAAVAAISASNPFPPLPTDFRGDRIVLQMTFLYNMPR